MDENKFSGKSVWACKQAEKLKSREMKEGWMKNDEGWMKIAKGWMKNDEGWSMMISSSLGVLLFAWQMDGHFWL